ncbi:hypothetical protein [Passion fruit chlorotic mottle virus]|uniref:Uncharacterized protein n=1 Tax=Passion fruit chlorotic mottle virus TaxID=2162638 RepID=A0A2R4Q8V3_9GEMI|nr:hypothetical protein [Passion fruit chlorotic mottle virus]AVY03269.1 hypothetical protein [Passion fruit chlorotic mottle virus]
MSISSEIFEEIKENKVSITVFFIIFFCVSVINVVCCAFGFWQSAGPRGGAVVYVGGEAINDGGEEICSGKKAQPG